ncbi:hypothetical protein DPMN_170036 [Dreissena polymorpha]|uniref:Uncharacterized protein n=1 Tax=Dreissena polymorpha TaxID=45954 RepID=A0A9D4DXV4_DREPO|nr:hypothetical protein DPMN_170036 [Dreissena polymorpha]
MLLAALQVICQNYKSVIQAYTSLPEVQVIARTASYCQNYKSLGELQVISRTTCLGQNHNSLPELQVFAKVTSHCLN